MDLSSSQKIFSALADRTRLRILSLLAEGELCVCDLMKVLKEPQSKISRHLSYLRRTGLVDARKEGLWMHYRLSKPAARMCRTLLDTVCACGPECREIGGDRKQLEQKKKELIGCCR